MKKLKEAYDVKKQLVATTNSINELGELLKNNSNIPNIDINSDNTMYLESNCGIDSIKDTLDTNIAAWINRNIEFPISMIYNVLPLSNESCIVRI